MIGTIGSHIGLKEAFKRIAEVIEAKSSDRVLEASIGAGMEIKSLHNNVKNAEYIGLDISFGMLKKCRRNSIKY